MIKKVKDLEKKAYWVRSQILEMIASARKGHIGGALSCTDILVTLFYSDIMRFDPKNPKWEKRDRFILSKGHSCPALYVILADLGFFPSSELKLFCQKSMLGGHPDSNIPGIEADTGSLGHGLGIASGMAISAKLDKKDSRVFVLLSDGELYEGSVWEAANFAAHHKLDNIVAFVDRNMQCVTDFTEDCNCLESLSEKWKSFGWEVKIIDGHSFKELLDVIKKIHNRKSSKPLVIIANTVKGKGVSFMENVIRWHHSIPSEEELEIARKELCSKI